MFAPDAASPGADIQVVALGDSGRLRACVDSLVTHVAGLPFTVTCVINPSSRHQQAVTDLPRGVRVLMPDLNLGWAGGLHLARSRTTAPYLIWAQEDMVVAPGWLDALVETAEAQPAAGAIGSVEVDPVTRAASGYAGGYAEPADSVAGWNSSDVLRAGQPSHGVPLDWVTSKGMLTRAEAFDDVGGTDPRLFPLNHIDKDYSTHLRSHGWQLFVEPRAQLFHEGSRSAPAVFRRFLLEWQEPDFDARWGDVVRALGPGGSRPVPHVCASWQAGDMVEIERLCGREASLMLVPFARYARVRLDGIQGALDAATAGHPDTLGT
ncbi:MAG: wbbL 4 [Schumannella sp.]|nr:wbbL 4 [Schumannella sp.]